MKNKILKFSIVAIIIVIFIVILSSIFLKNFIYKNEYLDIIESKTKDYYVDPYLVLSVIKAESNFDKDATSHKEAYGLMQLLHSTAKEVNEEVALANDLQVNDLYNEEVNIILGTKYISNLIKYYNGNYHLALCAYNAGCGNVDKWIEQGIIDKDFSDKEAEKIPYNETKNYIKRVINNYKMYKILY